MEMPNQLSEELQAFVQYKMNDVIMLLDHDYKDEDRQTVINLDGRLDRVEDTITYVSTKLEVADKVAIGKWLRYIISLRITEIKENETLTIKKQRLEILKATDKKIQRFLLNEALEDPYYPVKLDWNTNKYVLYELIRDLMHTAHGKKGAIIKNSVPELARFIKYNIKGFETTEISTIEEELRRQHDFDDRKRIKLPTAE